MVVHIRRAFSHYNTLKSIMGMHITFSVENDLLEEARQKALAEGTTLDALFSQWLTRYASEGTGDEQYDALMRQLSHITSGGRFDRDEMNNRA